MEKRRKRCERISVPVELQLWMDIHADTAEEAVETLNASLSLLDEPLPAPGPIQRVQLNVNDIVGVGDIVYVYDLDKGEECGS